MKILKVLPPVLLVLLMVLLGIYAFDLKLPERDANLPKTLYFSSTDFPPFYGERLEGQGYVTDLIVTAFSANDFNVKVDFLPWDRAVNSTKDGVYDGLFTMWESPEREQDFIFSDPFASNELVFFKMKNLELEEFESFDSLKAYKIGVVADYTYTDEFWDSELDLDLSTHEDDIFGKLVSGKVDLVLADRVVARSIIQQNFLSYEDEILTVEPAIERLDQHLVFPKTNPSAQELVTIFNDEFAEMKLDGRYQQILEKYKVSVDED